MEPKTSEFASSDDHSHAQAGTFTRASYDVSLQSSPIDHVHLPPSSMMNTATMRAVLIKNGKGPVENLYIGETAVPTLKPGEVLVKARTSCEKPRSCVLT